MSRFSVDREAFRKAARTLGLKHPVRVFPRRYEHLDGRYIGFDGHVHRIGVDVSLSTRLASRVLWHELTHALQVERLGGHDAFRKRWRSEMREAGLTPQQANRGRGLCYSRTPLEREAHANERRYRRVRLTQSI